MTGTPPSDAGSRWTAAMRAGAFEQAWRLSSEVLQARDPALRDDPTKPYHLRWVWDGRPFEGRDVLVRCYHGLGDTIQFARFLPLLASRAASVTVEVQPRLLGLLEGMMRRAGPPSLRLVPFDPAHPLPPAACDLEITELPFALRAGPDVVAMPYCAVRPADLPAGLIGLCNSAGDWDADRSIPAALFASLCAAEPCITLLPGASELAVVNPDGCPFDMDATAAIISATNLVISVDTMIAHLAGAMGKPVWLLLKAEPDWRWPLQGAATPWYPTMRLYHQPAHGDWEPVLRAVVGDLHSLTGLGAGERAMA